MPIFNCKACKDRSKYFQKAREAYEDILYLFAEAKKTFEQVIDEDESLCPGCKFWMKVRYGLIGGEK